MKLLAASLLATTSLAVGHPPAPTRLQVVAREYSFTLSRLTVHSGPALIELDNMGQDPHDLRVQRTGSRHIAGLGRDQARFARHPVAEAASRAILVLVLRRRSSSAWDAGDRDRHALSYDDVGDPAGVPVVYLHGGGDSRLSRHPDDTIAASLGVRLVAVDRCGPAVRRPTLRAWAEEILPRLPVDEFAVVGWSAGGPHALALAAVAPERVHQVAAVGSMPPPEVLGRCRGRRAECDAAREDIAGARPRPARAVGAQAGAADRQPGDATTPTRGAAWSPSAPAGCGSPTSSRYLARPWGFDLARRPCAGDALVRRARHDVPADDRARADSAGCRTPRLRLVDDTHQLLFTRWREILADVAPAPRTDR